MTEPSSPIIEVEGLTRSFWRARPAAAGAGWLGRLFPGRERAVALDGVSFSIQPGEFVGYIGPNGSGKSTTIKCLTGVLVPSAGSVRSLGLVPWQDRLAYTARIGVLFGQKSLLFWELPVRDAVEVYRELYGVERPAFDAWLERFDAVFGIGALLDRRVYTLSLGERMRCELAAAFLHRPELVFLDEPTIGLDAAAKDAVRQLLSQLHRTAGITVVLTTHQMDDIETLCTRLILLDRGRIRFDGTPAELRARYLPVKRLRVTFSRIADQARLAEVLGRVRVLERGFDYLWLEADAGVGIAHVTGLLLEALEVVDLEMSEPDLDLVLQRVYGARE